MSNACAATSAAWSATCGRPISSPKRPAGGRTGHQHRQRLNVRLSHCPGTAVHLQAHAEGIGANQARRARSCKNGWLSVRARVRSGGQDQVIDAQRLHAAAAPRQRQTQRFAFTAYRQ